MTRWTIGRRLAGIGALSAATALAVGAIGFEQASSASSSADRTFTIDSALSATIDIQHTASVVLADASMLTAALSPARRTEVLAQMAQHAGEMSDHLTLLEHTSGIGGEFVTQLGQFTPTVTVAIDDAARLAGTSGVLPDAQFGSVLEHWNALDASSDALKTLLTDQSAQAVAVARSGATRMKLVLLLVSLVSALVVVLFTWIAAKAITAPIRATKRLLEQVADGDFTGRVQVRAQDDLGQMATALNITVERVGQASGRSPEKPAPCPPPPSASPASAERSPSGPTRLRPRPARHPRAPRRSATTSRPLPPAPARCRSLLPR